MAPRKYPMASLGTMAPDWDPCVLLSCSRSFGLSGLAHERVRRVLETYIHAQQLTFIISEYSW